MEAVASGVPPLTAQYIKTRPSGPVPADVFICGEAPGAEEEIKGVPFVGSSGHELNRMLAQVGLQRDQAFLTNVCKYRPPENKIEHFFLDSKKTKPNALIEEGLAELKREIAMARPALILALGNTALWALTGNTGITKWRGSMLEYHYQDERGLQRRALLMPTYHPALILREWSWRPIAVHDLTRAAEALKAGSWPGKEKRYLVRPSFSDAMDCLGDLIRKANDRKKRQDHPLPVASDVEWSPSTGYIRCTGFAWSKSEAICIPNLSHDKPAGYFTLDEDVALWARERDLLLHPHVEVIGQNYLADSQLYARRRGYVPRLRHDTRIMQHVCWPGLPQSLDFIASMYSDHYVFWKEEGKTWEKGRPEEQYWSYNCDDTTYTFEAYTRLLPLLYKLKLYHLYRFQMRMWWSILRMMLRGVKVDTLRRSQIAAQLLEAAAERQNRLNTILGREFNTQSFPQMYNLFYNELRCKVVRNKTTKRPTCDEDALKLFAQREPLLLGIVEPIVELRSINTMISNVIQARAPDGRIRSQYSPTAESLRWTSSKDAFGDGTNLQNWTKGDEED